MGKSFSLAAAAFLLLVIAPCVHSQVIVSQRSVTLGMHDNYTVSGHDTDYVITVTNITDSDVRLAIDGSAYVLMNGTNLTDETGTLFVELQAFYYNLYSEARWATLDMISSCMPGCGDRDCGESSNGCGDCGTCAEGRDVCDDGYCIGVLGEYDLTKGDRVRLKVNQSYYLITVEEIARSIAKLHINDEHFDLFKSDPDTMRIVKDDLELLVTSFKFDENVSVPSVLTLEVKTKIEGCISDCSCVSNTCIGTVCGDGCGGFCNGIMEPDCGGRECGLSPNGCGICGDTGCPLHMRCGEAGSCVLWECMPYIVVIFALLGVIAALAYIAVKRKPYRTPSAIAGVNLGR